MTEPRRASDRGDTAALSAREALLRRDYSVVTDLLGSQRGLEAELRTHAVAAMPDVNAALNRWHAESPGDHVLHLLLAVRRLDDIPWLSAQLEQQRTAEQQHYDEVESLWRAIEHLQWAQAGGLEAAVVWMAAVAGALAWRGAMPMADFRRCAEAAQALVPDSIQVARWKVHLPEGDTETAVDIVEQAANAWPTGDPRHAEVVTAHVARYHVLLNEDRESAPAYWLRDDVLDSLVTVNERVEGCTGIAAFDVSALLAFVLPRTQQPRLGIPHLERLDGRVMTWPWAILRSPEEAFTEMEQRARAWSLKGMLRRR